MSKPEREAALEEVLEEAARLLRIAFVALYRLRLIDRGHDCSLSHELREFALEFSENDESGKHGVFRTGSGAYKSWRENVRALASTPPKPAEEQDPSAEDCQKINEAVAAKFGRPELTTVSGPAWPAAEDVAERLREILTPPTYTKQDSRGKEWTIDPDPYYDLEGALIDLERQGADKVCIDTIRRAQKRIGDAQDILRTDKEPS